MRRLVALVAMLAVAAPLAGCLTPPAAEAEEAPPSPSPAAQPPPPPAREPKTVTMTGTVGGTHGETKKLDVPADAKSLVIVADWSIGGTAYFKLVRPGGAIAKDDSVSGGSSRGASEWFTMDDPDAGTWELSVSASGGGSYRFEITY